MIKDNILKVKERISLICARINREVSSVSIVAVSKGRTPQQIKEVIEAGITDIGENKVQEALTKHRELSTGDWRLSTVKWHMVGHLQTNKVKDAVRIFDLIQSVDSLRLAETIDKEAAKIHKRQDVLMEIKTSPEATKFGLKPGEAIKVMEEIANLKNINIKGLMTIAPLVDSPEKARSYFKVLKDLKDKINARRTTHDEIQILSMGMTDDFEIAIEEGSDILRLGRAIFSRY
ncbi:MAG: YggS family pyridoxal phosphate-dependent enzyme [Candidatus Omnitrophota bacterium]